MFLRLHLLVAAALLAAGCQPDASTAPVPTAAVVVATPAPDLSSSASPPPPPVAAPVSSSLPSAEQLAAAVRPHLAEHEDRLGLVVEHVPSDTRVEHQAQRLFASASLYKLAVAYAVLRQVDRGELALEDALIIEDLDMLDVDDGDLAAGDELTVRQALEAMLGHSSNAAAFALLRLIGRPEFNALLVELGLRHTSVPLFVGQTALPGSAPLDPERAVTTAADLARLLRLLATDQLLTPPSRAELHRLLALEEPTDPLGPALPPEAAVQAKTGNLPRVSNLAGLIATPAGPVLLAVLTEDTDPDQARATIAEIGRAIYRLYTQ